MSGLIELVERFADWISRLFARFWTHIFVIATGFAALTHSTWTLATAFGGSEPSQFTGAWWSWLIPGFLIAFSFDIGQIAISVELRNGERTRAKYIAFLVLAISTYFLQWWYLAHHLPSLVLAEGLRPDWKPFASFMSDAIIWIAPGLLPLATTLYTWSYGKPPKVRIAPQPLRTVANAKMQSSRANDAIALATTEQIALPKTSLQPALPAPELQAMILVKCDKCGKDLGMCEEERQKTNKLNAHNRFCPANIDIAKGT